MLWPNFESEWNLSDKVVFDTTNKLIIVNDGVTTLDIRADVWSAWVRWFSLLDRNYDVYDLAMERAGVETGKKLTDSQKKQTPCLTRAIGRTYDQQSKQYKPQKSPPPCIAHGNLHSEWLPLFWPQRTDVLLRHNPKGAYCIPWYSPRVRFATASA